MFTAANKLNGGWEMKEDATGQVMFVPDQQADQMFSQGTAKRSGGGGGGMSEAPNSLGAFSQDFGAPGRAALPAEPPRPLGRNQALAPPGGIKGVNSVGYQPPAVAPMQSTRKDPSQLTRVSLGQGQQQAPREQLTERVRVGGRKAGMVPVGEQQSGVLPEQQDEMFRRQEELYSKQLDVANKTQDVEAERLANKRIELMAERATKEDALKQRESENVLKDQYARGEIKKLADGVKAVKEQRVPTWHDDVGMGGTLLSAIAMAGGAYASAINGGPNMAMQIIDRAIDRDMENKQKAKADRVSAAEGSKQDFLDDFAFDSQTRRAAEKAARDEAVAAKLAAYQADEALAAYGPQMEQLKLAYAERANQAWQGIAQTVQHGATKRYDPGSAGGYVTRLTPEAAAQNAELGAQGQRRQLEAAANPSQGTTPETVTDWSGKAIGRAPTKDVAKELNDGSIAARKTANVIDQLLELQNKGSNMSSADRARYETLNEQLINVAAQAANFRLGTETDVERMRAIVGRGIDTWTHSDKVRLESFREQVLEENRVQHEHYGIPLPGIPTRGKVTYAD